MREKTFACASCGYNAVSAAFPVARVPGSVRSLECRRRVHKRYYQLAWECPRCGKATCTSCHQEVDPQATLRAERKATLLGIGGFALAVSAVVLFLWTPWDSPDPRQSSNVSFDYVGDPYTDCEGAYENEFNPAWGDAEAVKQIPGCEGWLPPPPGLLPGYDQDCSDITGPVNVGTSDPYGLDQDGDGIGCEPYER